jgi:small GTP-binding protein
MIQKKICMLGGFAVGKTSMVARFVSSIFSDKYLSTVGVKIDKKTIAIDGREVMLVLWDIYGQDAFQTVQSSYIRGAAGYLLVVDGTRIDTFATARDLQQVAVNTIGGAPFVLALNKSDLASEWQIDERALFDVAERGWPIVRTSAKTGAGVEQAFERLARAMLSADER